MDEFLDALSTADFCFFIDDFSFALEMRLNELNFQRNNV